MNATFKILAGLTLAAVILVGSNLTAQAAEPDAVDRLIALCKQTALEHHYGNAKVRGEHVRVICEALHSRNRDSQEMAMLVMKCLDALRKTEGVERDVRLGAHALINDVLDAEGIQPAGGSAPDNG